MDFCSRWSSVVSKCTRGTRNRLTLVKIYWVVPVGLRFLARVSIDVNSLRDIVKNSVSTLNYSGVDSFTRKVPLSGWLRDWFPLVCWTSSSWECFMNVTIIPIAFTRWLIFVARVRILAVQNKTLSLSKRFWDRGNWVVPLQLRSTSGSTKATLPPEWRYW